MLCGALGLSGNCHTRYAVKIVVVIFANAIYQQVLFLVDEVMPVVFGHFKIACQLNGIGGTRLFKKKKKNAAGKVDTEEFRIPPTIIPFCLLQRYATNRT